VSIWLADLVASLLALPVALGVRVARRRGVIHSRRALRWWAFALSFWFVSLAFNAILFLVLATNSREWVRPIFANLAGTLAGYLVLRFVPIDDVEHAVAGAARGDRR
jgi:hypothetical protein